MGAQVGEVDFGPVMAVADAVMYEGYVLYPYRPSSGKNRVRWQFGVLAPRRWVEADGPASEGVSGSAESWWNRTECLLEAKPGCSLEVRLRYLEVGPPASGQALDQAAPREAAVAFSLEDVLGTEMAVPAGRPGAGAHGQLVVMAERVPAPFPLHKLVLRTENNVGDVGATASRPEVLRRSFVSSHLLLGARDGSFLSLLYPPEWARLAAAGCHNVRAFPVLAGPPGRGEMVVSAPIILYDYPRVAPESPGDLFDATEIDEILSLRTLALTAAEKREARAGDPRAAEIVDRVDGMPAEVLARLHGAVRSLRPVGAGGDYVVVSGERVRAGSRVRLRPRPRGTDAQDMFLAARTATVASVLTDVDGSRFLAVTVDGDPRASLCAGPGRLLHFSPDEVEPLAGPGGGELT
ncbi:MAG: hypothetical protein ACRDZX_15295 [Acidimicrobiales bacterium]